MIKPQHFVSLAAVTLATLLLTLGVWAASNRWSTGKVEGTQVLPGLTRQSDSIGTVELRQGDKKMTLKREGPAWKIAERDGYPANPERVRSLLMALARTELVEARTASRDKWKALELEDPTAKDAKSRSLRILDAKGGALGELVLGKARPDAFGPGKGGIYVRRPGEAQTWLAMGDPKGGVDIKDWLALTPFETDSAKITKVTAEHPGEEPLVVEKGDGKEVKFKLAKIPAGMKVKQGVNVEHLATGFASLEIEDVRRLAQTPTGDQVSVLKLETEGGPLVTFRIRKDGEASWISFSAAGEGDSKKRAEEINAKSVGWEYKLPQWKLDQIAKRGAELFEKDEPEKQDDKPAALPKR